MPPTATSRSPAAMPRSAKQYKYHPEFRAARETGKYDHLLDFAAVLPQIRETVAKHMAKRDLGRENACWRHQ